MVALHRMARGDVPAIRSARGHQRARSRWNRTRRHRPRQLGCTTPASTWRWRWSTPNRDRLAPDDRSRRAVSVHRLGGSDAIGLGGGPTSDRRLMRTGGYDVVHVHGPLPSVIVRVAASVAARHSASARVVTTSHTPWNSLHVGYPQRMAAHGTPRRRDHRRVGGGGCVAACRLARQRAVVIPHGIDPERIAAASAVGRLLMPHGKKRGRLRCVGHGGRRRQPS